MRGGSGGERGVAVAAAVRPRRPPDSDSGDNSILTWSKCCALRGTDRLFIRSTQVEDARSIDKNACRNSQPTQVLEANNMAFTDSIANVNAADPSNKITLRIGSSTLKLVHCGFYEETVGWYQYKRSANGTMHNSALVCSMTDVDDMHQPTTYNLWTIQVHENVVRL